MDILVVEKSNPMAWVLMPVLMTRIQDFIKRYESDSDPKLACQTLIQHFVSDTPGVVALLALDGTKIVGHCVASTEIWDGRTTLVVTQFETDLPLPVAFTAAALGWLERWAAANRCEFLQCLTANEKLARLFQTRYGFSKRMVLMRKPLIELTDEPRQTAIQKSEVACREQRERADGQSDALRAQQEQDVGTGPTMASG